MTRTQIFDHAEAAITRVLKNGRAFVNNGRVMEAVMAMGSDAEIELFVRDGTRGWWIELA